MILKGCIKKVTNESAISLYNSHFWEHMTDEDIAKWQLHQTILCMEFDLFHELIEKLLDREYTFMNLGLWI